MDFSLTEDQRLFADQVARFAKDHLADGALARAHEPAFPWDVARLMAANGLLGITMAVEDGGQGGTFMDAVLAIEQVALACPRSADVVMVGTFGPIRTLAEYATAAQKEQFLRPLLRGEGVIAIGMTEPEAGSAMTDLVTAATPDGAGYRINGTKIFTSHSPDATLFLVFVRFGPGTDGIGTVLIERDAPGFTLGRPTRFVSGDSWRQLYFDDVYVAPENVLMPPGRFRELMAAHNAERIGNCARSLAFGRYAFDFAREHARTRRQFGRPLCEFQGIQWKFADMAMQIEAGQLLLYRAATNADRGLPSVQETAIAKVFCNRAGFEVANECLQILGGMGFTQETLVEYCVRRARGYMISGGSIEIMKNRIAEGVFGRAFSQRPPRAPR